jgi:hypothetical protein
MKRLLIILLILLTGCRAWGLAAEIGVDPFRLEAGSRPLAMGAAFVGLGDDLNTVLYNPGGLAWVKGISMTMSDFDNLTGVMAFPTGNNSSLGLAIVTAKSAQIPVPAGGVAAANSSVVLMSYGTKLSFIPLFADQDVFQKLGFGISLKGLLGETLGRTGQSDRAATGWDMDMGVLWRTTDWWQCGASLQNFLPAGSPLGGGTMSWDAGSPEGFPASLKLGGSAKIIGDLKSPIFLEGRELLLAGELDLSRASSLLRIGGEWGIDKTYYFRAGIIQQDKPGGPTTNLSLGLGYRLGEWGADLVSSHDPLRDENQVCLSILYLPKEWVVQKKLDFDRPALLEQALQKISLFDNLETYDDRIEVVGQVKSEVDVFVNDARAVTGSDNQFRVTVPLQVGKNLVVVEARYEGEVKDWKYKVLRKVKVDVSEEKALKEQLALAASSAETEALRQKEAQIAAKKNKVEELVTLGVVEVTPGAEFKLDASLTRGELATWLAKASGFRLPKVENDLYSDVKKDDPLAPYIKVVVDVGLMAPYADGTFHPELPVTKEEGNKLFALLRKTSR